MTITALESDFQGLLANLARLRESSASSAEKSQDEIDFLQSELIKAQNELDDLEQEFKHKQVQVSLHISSLLAADLNQLVEREIAIPESKLELFWTHLKLRVEALPAGGGVAVTIGFSPESRLPDLRFALKHSVSENAFFVFDCDPIVIGLADLVAQLNSDSKCGALARFCCRVRARYTAQYSSF